MTEPHLMENLLKWLRTFETASDVHFVSDISDGRVLSHVLFMISPKHFTQEWLSQLSQDEPNDWTAKANNLSQILRAIVDFLTEVPDERLSIDPEPDVVAIAKHNDEVAAVRLLQLVLGCAVNCEAKETYIEAIMRMEESVQQSLMEAIQQLMCPRTLAMVDTYPELVDEPLVKAVDQCKSLLTENAGLAQKCHELELELVALKEEKQALQSENESLRARVWTTNVENVPLTGAGLLAQPIGGDPVASLSPTVANVRIGQLQDQVSKLRSEVYRLETGKEELEMKLTLATATNQDLKQKCEQLALRADEADHLKDELDIAREELAASSHLTTQLEQLRKRADEAVELRVRCAKLTEDNRVCVDRLRELELETRFTGNLRSQAETQRLQAADARLEANEANQRAEAAEAELCKVREELTGTVREKMLLVTELNRLRACCEELQMCVIPARGVEEDMAAIQSESTNLRFSPAIQSQMLNLQEELSRLRTSLSNVEGATVPGTVENGTSTPVTRCSQGFQTRQPGDGPLSSPESSAMTNGVDDAMETGRETDEVASLRSQLAQKESQISAVEQKYRGYLWKAREVIRVLEREQRRLRDLVRTPDSNDPGSQDPSTPEIERLRALLVEKEDIIEKLELHHEQSRRHRDAEERILVSAWYNLIGTFTRDAVEQRIQARMQPTVSGTEDCHPIGRNNQASFLERQRELHLKPPRGLTSVVVASK